MLEDTVMLEFESTAAEYYGKLDNDAQPAAEPTEGDAQ